MNSDAPQPKLTVTVIGGGSVGLTLAASFAIAGARVALMVRPGSVSGLQNEAITIAGMLGEHTVPAGTIDIVASDDPTIACMNCDMLVVTTKAYDVALSLEPFARRDALARPRAVLLMQNGLGSAEAARAVMGAETPIFSTAMLIGMQRHGLSHVRVNAYSSPVHAGALLGDSADALQPIIEVAAKGFLPMAYAPKIRDTIFGKLLFNSCMNPTGALIGLSYGELLENPYSRGLIARLADETLHVFAAGTDFRPAASGQDYVEKTLIPVVIPRSAPHRSSMVQDLESGRPTEIDYLNGAIVRMGQELGIPTPFHESIVALIHAKERPSAPHTSHQP